MARTSTWRRWQWVHQSSPSQVRFKEAVPRRSDRRDLRKLFRAAARCDQVMQPAHPSPVPPVRNSWWWPTS